MRSPCFKILWLLALVCCAPLAHAQVYRCIGAHGEPAFSGQPCGTLASQAGIATANPSSTGALGGVCAASPQLVRDQIAMAFHRDDVNLLAGLILWDGFGQSYAREALRSLAGMLKQPLTGIAFASAADPPGGFDSPPYYAPIPSTMSYAPAASASAAPHPTGIVVSTQPEGIDAGNGDSHDFGLTQIGGCWWLML